MEKGTMQGIKQSVKHWYLPLVSGLLFIGGGCWVLRTPLESYITLAILFAVLLFITGIVEIAFAVTNRSELGHWGWSLMAGVLDFIVGFILVMHPDVSIAILPFYIGFVVMFRSMLAIGWAIEMRRLKAGQWGALLAIGILGIIFSFIILTNPLLGGLTIVFYTAWALIIVGVFNLSLAFRLRKLASLK